MHCGSVSGQKPIRSMRRYVTDNSGDKRPRFIAGAVCPACQALDRLVIEQLDGETQRRCVACGFTDSQVSHTTGGVPTGKRDKSAQGRPIHGQNVDVQEVRVVKLVNPSEIDN